MTKDKYQGTSKCKNYNSYIGFFIKWKYQLISNNALTFVFRLDDDLRESRPIPKVPQDKLLAILLKNHQNEIFKYHEHQSLLENMPNEKLDEEEMKLAWEEFHKENEVQGL